MVQDISSGSKLIIFPKNLIYTKLVTNTKKNDFLYGSN